MHTTELWGYINNDFISLQGDLALYSIHKRLMHNAWNQFHKWSEHVAFSVHWEQKINSKKMRKGQVMEVHLDILGREA